MKRSMVGPQGQNGLSNKRSKIQAETRFQPSIKRKPVPPKRPVEPPTLVAGAGSLARVPTFQAEKEVERLLGLDTTAQPLFGNETQIRDKSGIPEEFKAYLRRQYERGALDGKVLDYYSDVLPQGDSTNVPGQGGRSVLLKSIMGQEDALPAALVAGPAWRPVRILGKGGFGEVMLWEKARKNGPRSPIRIATKESRPHDFFKDYCSEAHLTRRLNDLGCKNVINVVEWAYIEEKFWRNEMGKLCKSEPRHRICYEYADHGDFWDLINWYHSHRLILPEAFLWHVMHSMANALCYCCYGTNKPSAYKRGWDGIVHMDIKPENMLLTTPNQDTQERYPCIKLADFGLAHTIGVSVAEIRYFKSAGPGVGTEGFVAPEVMDKTPEKERRRRHPHELIGPHCDVFSLGRSIESALNLLGTHYETLEFMGSKGFDPGSEPGLERVYTPDLWSLISWCQNPDARNRPKLHSLYRETKARMEHCLDLARKEEREALSDGIPGCFHANVLFKKEDRDRFESDPIFRVHYRKANLQPVSDIVTELFAQNQAPAEVNLDPVNVAQPNVAPPNVAQPNVAQPNVGTGQQRGGLPARVARKIEKKVKERRKRTARVQEGIRGLLSKMNFFS